VCLTDFSSGGIFFAWLKKIFPKIILLVARENSLPPTRVVVPGRNFWNSIIDLNLNKTQSNLEGLVIIFEQKTCTYFS